MFDQTLTRQRAPMKAQRAGDQVRDWGGTLVPLEIRGANVQPITSAELGTIDADALVETYRVSTRPWSVPDVDALDRIEWRGVTWNIKGVPLTWPDPATGAEHHVTFTIERVRK